MRPRPTLFNSVSETELFQAIQGTWEPVYRLFPQIPFANLVELDEHRLTAEELGFLNKTSVDFVLTTNAFRPLFVLEFDGLGHGYSRNGTYVQAVPSRKDRHREWKLGLKARVAAQAGLPFVVVSYDEKAVIDRETGLMIVHGIIGQFLASNHASQRVHELYDEQREMIEAMPEGERGEYVQDYIVISAEVEADLDWNPICSLQSRLRAEALRLSPMSRWGDQYLHDPPRPDNTVPFSPGFDGEALLGWWSSIRRWGSECWIDTTHGKVTSGPVWVRNIEAPGVHPICLAQEIAELVAWRNALDLLRSQQGGNEGAA